MKKYQIGVMGSAADLKYSEEVEKIAEEVGKRIAEKGHYVLYGAEKDYDSLSTAAARGAKKANGTTIGITYGQGKDIWDKEGNTDIIISSGLERGGGREFVLINSCDAVIAVSGGSGTLSELAIAYQLNKPMVVLNNTGGWAEKLANTYLDNRQRQKVYGVDTAEQAVDKIIELLDNQM
jgi:uncharacterized protein (TIGR00725 family)